MIKLQSNPNKLKNLEINFNPKTLINFDLKINSPNSLVDLIYDNWDWGTLGHREEFKAILFNHRLNPLGIITIGMGSITEVQVDTAIIAQAALLANATRVAVCHNHPTGDPTPSQSDITITTKIREALNLLNIKLIDHIIITPTGKYTSMESGLNPETCNSVLPFLTKNGVLSRNKTQIKHPKY